ncbi:MAG: hypothetical protein M3Q66_03120, partial [Chloroflexota bacterium]|nr:hypothetical protein [Chloroflexota bacterium]
AVGAEKYSRRLSERITEGYAAKFDQEHDPGGRAGLGSACRTRRTPLRSTPTACPSSSAYSSDMPSGT